MSMIEIRDRGIIIVVLSLVRAKCMEIQIFVAVRAYPTIYDTSGGEEAKDPREKAASL